MWLKEFQIAIIEKDTQKIDELISVPLKFDSVDDMKSAMYLLAEASKLLHGLKDETKQTIIQLKKNIDFQKDAPHISNSIDSIKPDNNCTTNQYEASNFPIFFLVISIEMIESF